MKRGVLWAQGARDDFKSAVKHIAKHNIAASRRVAAVLRKTASDLGNLTTGRPGRVDGMYEKSVTGLPYIIAYEIDSLPDGGERIVIVRVIHTARHWPKQGWPE